MQLVTVWATFGQLILAKSGRFSNWLPLLPDEIVDHKYVYEEIGYNIKPLEMQASIGLVQLKN